MNRLNGHQELYRNKVTTRKGKTIKTNLTTKTRSGFRKWLVKDFWKVCTVGILLFAAYGFYLNAQITHSFGSNKWQVPAQIYARPLIMSVGDTLSQKELMQELSLLGYRQVNNARKIGEFSQYKGTFQIVRRAFAFPDQPEPHRRIEVALQQGKIHRLSDLGNGQALKQARLEPWLVTRLMSGSQEDRMLVVLEEIPDGLIQALLITEDKDFYHHQGVSPLSILRALIANIVAGRTVQEEAR